MTRRFDYVRIAELRKSGLSHAEIAAQVGCASSTVERALNMLGMVRPYGGTVSRRNSGKRASRRLARQAKIEFIRGELEAGKTHQEIADHFKLSRHSISNFCWEHGLTNLKPLSPRTVALYERLSRRLGETV